MARLKLLEQLEKKRQDSGLAGAHKDHSRGAICVRGPACEFSGGQGTTAVL